MRLIRTRRALALLACMLCAGMAPALAAPTLALACNGCTLAQEEQAALAMSGPTVRFVYNLASNRVRKFNVLLEADGLNGAGAPVTDPAAATGERADRPVRAPSEDMQAQRVLDEMDVDPDMAAVFQTMIEIHQAEPTFLSKRWREDIGILQPGHSPRDVAWGSGTGSSHFNNFMDEARDLLGNANLCASSGINVRLCDYIHGVRLAASWSMVLTPRGPEVGIALSGMAAETRVEFCDSALDCVEVTVSVTAAGIQVEFERGFDMTNTNLPVGPEVPGRLDYGGNHARFGAERTGRDILRRFNSSRPVDYFGPPSCWEAYLSCAWVRENWRLLGCTITCLTP